MWPFKPGSFLDVEDENWQVATWQSFLKAFGGLDDLQKSPLVTPSSSFFPASSAEGHARAEYVFDCVKQQAGMQNWPCNLVAQPVRPEARVSEFVFLKPVDKGLPLGTFGVSNNEVIITYDPGSSRDPMTLVSTFAHELAHYRLVPLREELPGGEEMHEFATDLMTVYMGFGIFGADGAFNFSQHQDFMGRVGSGRATGTFHNALGYLRWLFFWSWSTVIERRRQISKGLPSHRFEKGSALFATSTNAARAATLRQDLKASGAYSSAALIFSAMAFSFAGSSISRA